VEEKAMRRPPRNVEMVVDVPGHARLRSSWMQEYWPVAGCVVLCVRRLTQVRDLADVAQEVVAQIEGRTEEEQDQNAKASRKPTGSVTMNSVVVCSTHGEECPIETVKKQMRREWELARVPEEVIEAAMNGWQWVQLDHGITRTSLQPVAQAVREILP
jgi:hypothetical protein